ncbi:MAG TPA: SRPBCC domain-containing protein [Hanamia sp.]|nr:SRPBCC domain-containing protein [Hanamia sp.]
MERKTKVDAEEGKQDLLITREFELPVNLLFKAYSDKEILEQWMGTKVLKLENKTYGGWQFETKDQNGKTVFKAHGVIHTFDPDKKIVRTFEMENAPFGVQLEILNFEKLSEDSSKLIFQSIYESNELRDQVLKLPFAYGINMAHNRLEEIVSKLK